MSTVSPQPLPKEVYAIFSGEINGASVQRIINGVTSVMGQVEHIHLLFQSNGGYIGDGICLYNFFRALTLDLIIYNGGSVGSIAAIAFLGAKTRKTSKFGTFMIHRSHWSANAATAARLQEAAESLRIDDARTEAILRNHIILSDEQWTALNYKNLTFGAEEAVKIGFAIEIAEFTPPPGARIFTA
jgi:ATP-dependent Clp protease protease subunit